MSKEHPNKAETLEHRLQVARTGCALALAGKLGGNNVARYRNMRRRVVLLERLIAARKGRQQ